MKTKHLISALFALAGLAVGAHAASSGVPDLVVGFEQSGTATDYELDLGSMASYVGLSSPTDINLNGDLSLATINSLFNGGNPGALANGTVLWGAVATVGGTGTTLNGVSEGADTAWVGQLGGTTTGLADTNVAAPGSTYHDKTALSGASGRQSSIVNLYPLLSGSNTANQTAASSQQSWSSYSTASSNGFSSPLDAGTGINITSGYAYLNLYQYGAGSTSTPGAYIGSLSLGSNGSLDFTNYIPTAAAIPEPSTYAAILGVASLGVVLIRRRKQQVIA
jgi:hypothetical protein